MDANTISYNWVNIASWTIVVIAVLVLLSFMFNCKGVDHFEGLENVSQPVPPYVDPKSNTIMSGSGFLPPTAVIPPWGDQTYGESNELTQEELANMSVHYDMCSKACCSAQFPPPFKLSQDESVCLNKDSFEPSSYMCNNSWQDSGCVCMTKGQSEYLASRGGNH